MGNIRRQGKDSWEIRWCANGERGRETINGKKSNAKNRLAEIEYKIANGTFVPPTKIILAEFLEKQWLVHIKLIFPR